MAASASEINIIGTFEWKNSREEAAILREIEEGKSIATVWNPSTDDFDLVARHGKNGTTIRINSLLQLLGVIIQTGSISRINVFTHASRAFVAFQGYLVRGDVLMDTKTAMSLDNLDTLNSPEGFFLIRGGKKQKFFLQDVRKRFTTNAVIVLYACHSGVDLDFLNTIQDTFQVTVIGFKRDIAYKVNVVGGRKHSVEIGYDLTQTKTNFHDLNLNDPEHVNRVSRKAPQPVPKSKP